MTESDRRKSVAEAAALIVANTRHTRYQHDPFIDPATGTYNLDSAAFVSLVLRDRAPKQYAEIPGQPGWPCPRASDYFDFLASLAFDGKDGWTRSYEVDGAAVAEMTFGWRALARLSDVRPGDVIAWCFSRPEPGGDTGHVLLVAERPQPVRGDVLAVRVFDASRVPHFDDSRTWDKEGCEGGVGQGAVLFQVDRATGAPIAVQVLPAERYKSHHFDNGRVEPFNARVSASAGTAADGTL